jgi:hypothetical protein
MDGEELAAAIRQRHPDVPTVFLSSSISARGEGGVRRGERDWHVRGSCEPGDLLSAIDTAIAHCWAVPAWKRPPGAPDGE